MERRNRKTNEGRSLAIVPLRDLTDQVTEHFMTTLMGAAGFVLLLACLNVGSLQAARATSREKEICVRAALGASRFQIARQLVTETLLLSIIGGIFGLVLASWYTDYGKSKIPPLVFKAVPGLRVMHVDATVVALAVMAALIGGVLCSAPAVLQLAHRKMRADLTDVLRGRGGTSSSRPARSRLRATLIVFELALALVLLVGAGLMVKTFERLLYVNQGFDAHGVLTAQISLPTPQYSGNSQIISFYDRALESLGTLPKVMAAGLSSEAEPAEHFYIEGRPEPRAGEPHPAVTAVSDGYIRTLRISLLDGRSISSADRAGTPRVAVISANVARYYWHDSNPIGHRIRFDSHSDWLTIVGVSGNVINDWFSGRPDPLAYVSYPQFPRAHARFVLRTPGDPMRVAAALRSQVHKVDADLPIYGLQTLERELADERSGVRAAADMMTIYAVIALLLAVTGVYGVISYFVSARTHDIGVHVALGATRRDVFKMAMRQTLGLTALGLLVGVPLSIMVARAMSSALYEIVKLDTMTFAPFAVILTMSALLAAYVPSRRATRIDPMSALRER
jgi:putative ABC transport system permease protein